MSVKFVRQVVVSDHALIRWLERAHNIDMEFFRGEIYDTVYAAAAVGATNLIRDGVEYRMKNGTVTTVIADDRATAIETVPHERAAIGA